jgi:hypothetical protein
MKARPSDSSVPGYSRLSDEQREKNWNAFFRDAHLACVIPPVTCTVSMLLYHCDDDIVDAAAKKNGFKVYFKTKGNIGYIKEEKNERHSDKS